MRRSPSQKRTAPAHDGLHDLDRPGRDQPGDRRRARAREPAARPAAAGRHLRRAASRTRCCNRSRTSAIRPSPPTIACGPSRVSGIASRGRSNCSRRCRRRSRCCWTRPIAARRRSRCRRTCRRRPSTTRSPSSTSACTTSSGRGRTATRLAEAAQRIKSSRRPLIVAGGGVHYADAQPALAEFAARHGIPVAETQAGKGALAWDHPCNAGAIGVTGSSAANALLAECGPRARARHAAAGFHDRLGQAGRRSDARLVAINVARHDAIKRGALAVRGDLLASLEELAPGLGGWAGGRCAGASARARSSPNGTRPWMRRRAPAPGVPTDAQVLGAVNRALGNGATVVCAAGGLPGELHKLWRCPEAGRLPRRVRLLVHGLRDRRRPRREDGGPGPHGRGPGRRRQLSDDELGDRDLGRARSSAPHRARATIAASAASTGCSARRRASRTTTCWKDSFPAERRSTSSRTRARSAPTRCRSPDLAASKPPSRQARNAPARPSS